MRPAGRQPWRTLVAALGLAGALLAGPGTAVAATRVVDVLGDVTAADGKTTLREAVAAAAAGDTIEFASSLFGATPATLTLSAPLVVTKSLTVVGPGDTAGTPAPKLVLTVTGAQRILQVQAPAAVVIAGVGFRGGSAAGGGAVLIDAGAVATFQACDFTDNTAGNSGNGGAILNRGTLTLDQCLVRGNRANHGGGVASEGTLTLVRSLVEANTAAGNGGGVFIDGGTAALESSTLSGNQAGTGGGLAFVANGRTERLVTLTAVTVAGNSAAAQSGGLYVEGAAARARVGGSVFAQNVLVSNKSGAPTLHDLGNTRSGRIDSADYNLFVKPGTTLSPWGPNDQVGTDPRLAALAYNGGRTRTHLPGPGSAALDRGNPAFGGTLVTTDQRRFPRVAPAGGRTDIGAVEVGSPVTLALRGEATITLGFGTPFVDPGVDLNAPAGTVLTTAVNGVVGGQISPCCPGTYVIVYTATYAGFTATATRTVIVTESIALQAPAKVIRYIAVSTGTASVDLGSIVTLSGFPANVACTLNYAVSVTPSGYSQSGLTTLPTLTLGQTGTYLVNVKAFSPCSTEVGAVSFQLVIDPGNVVWPLAINLDPRLLPAGTRLIGSIQQSLTRAGESRWYKFTGKPGSRIDVTLSQLPANYDLVVYGDIDAAYAELLALINPSSPPASQALALLGAEFAPEAYSPEAYSPEAYSPEAYSPEAYSPEAYSPEAYSPEAYSPEAYSPEAYSPEAYSPEAYSPEAYSPEAYSPEAYSPEAYASAQQRSLVAFSAAPGTSGESVRFNTYSRSGVFYVRVRGQNGVFVPDALFTLTVALQQDLCAGVTDLATTPATVPAAVAGAPTSLLLWDSARIAGTATEKAALATALGQFAAAANGLVVDLNSDARIRALNQQADANPTCPEAKNLVAEAIRRLIQGYRKVEPTLADITLVGNDDVIPFFRTQDEALLASEANYFPPVQDATASQASLRYAQVLTQDRYGSSCQVVLATGPYDLPEIPTGRLVETAAEVAAYLDTYRALFDGTLGTGGVVPTPRTGFVAGYDFLADSAAAMRDDFAAGLGAGGTVNTLISAADVPPIQGWTANQLRTAFLGTRHDLAYLAAHFSTGRLLAADYSSRFRAREVADSAVNLAYALILSAGCHSGYSTVDPHALPLLTDQPDWAQAFARKRAMWISGTGYQYGDTDFIEYTERLLLEVARSLRGGTGAVPVGRALVEGKRRYLADTAIMRGIHEKTLLQVVLYGLPMVKINLPGARVAPPAAASDIAAVSPVATGPGVPQGLRTGSLTVTPALTRVDRTLDVVGTNETVVASYFRGSDGIVAVPGEPVRPLENFNVGRPEGFVRGVGFRGGQYADLAGFRPFTGAPATETRGVHGGFATSVFFPVRPWNLNLVGAVCDLNGFSELNVFPAQYVSDAPDAPTGTLRRYDQMQFTVFYSPAATEAALANPPAINVVASTVGAGTVTFSIETAATLPAGVQEVWITYTGLPGTALYGRWQSLSLAAPAGGNGGNGTWTGQLALNGVNPTQVRYLVQAVNGVGAVALNTNFGRYFVPGTSTLDQVGVINTPTTVTLGTGVPASAPYRATVPVTARLAAGGVALAGKRIDFKLGPATATALTDSNGVATASLLVTAQPGLQRLEASFSGDATYRNSADARDFTVTRAPTSLTFELPPGNAFVVATLKAQDGTPLKERTVVFIFTLGTSRFALAEITDGAGQARVPASVSGNLPDSITVTFGQPVLLPDNTVAPLTDLLYQGTTASGSL